MRKKKLNKKKLKWFRGFIQGKTRIVLAWFFSILLGWLARDYPTWPGVLLCFLGATLRFWASGYLRKDTRPAVGGPYAYVRNPLYLGTYLMAVGIVLSLRHGWLLGGVTVLFAVIYHFIILDEEVKLQSIFKNSYFHYCQTVPRFFPNFWSPFFVAHRKALLEVNPETENHVFSWVLAMKNKAYEAYAAFLGLVVFVYLAAYFWKSV